MFKLSFSADKSNRGWRGKHRLPPPSHMAIVSYKACYIVFISSPDISQEATDAKLLAKKNHPNLQILVRAVLQFICVLLFVFFFLLLFFCLVSISTLSVLPSSVLFCLVLFFYHV